MSHFDFMSRLNIVFDRIKNLCRDDEDFADSFVSDFEDFLNDLSTQDAFGTEGQLDPRGDQRDDSFNMHYVQGFDD